MIPNLFTGVQIIESRHLMQDGPPTEVPIPWRERLWSWPWRPWVATRTVILKVPHQGALQIRPNVFVMHPETLRELRASQGVTVVRPPSWP